MRQTSVRDVCSDIGKLNSDQLGPGAVHAFEMGFPCMTCVDMCVVDSPHYHRRSR